MRISVLVARDRFQLFLIASQSQKQKNTQRGRALTSPEDKWEVRISWTLQSAFIMITLSNSAVSYSSLKRLQLQNELMVFTLILMRMKTFKNTFNNSF